MDFTLLYRGIRDRAGLWPAAVSELRFWHSRVSAQQKDREKARVRGNLSTAEGPSAAYCASNWLTSETLFKPPWPPSGIPQGPLLLLTRCKVCFSAFFPSPPACPAAYKGPLRSHRWRGVLASFHRPARPRTWSTAPEAESSSRFHNRPPRQSTSSLCALCW